VVQEKTWLEKLMDVLPGFKGYRRREYIREDDQLIREYLSRILLESMNILNGVTRELALSGNMKAAMDLDDIVREIRVLTDKIRWAPHGYKPHYDIVKFKEEDLDALRKTDEKLVDVVNSVLEEAKGIKDAVGKGGQVDLSKLSLLVSEAKTILLEREKILLRGVG